MGSSVMDKSGAAGWVANPDALIAPRPHQPLMKTELPRLPPIRLRSLPKNLDELKEGEIAPNLLQAVRTPEPSPAGAHAAGSQENGLGSPTTPLDATARPSRDEFQTPPQVTMGPIVISPPVGPVVSPAHESSAVRRARISVSQGIVEDVDSVLSPGIAAAPALGQGRVGLHNNDIPSSDFPEANWDSDAYDDDDDVGYARQLIDDEDWFFSHEIASDDERARPRPAEADAPPPPQEGKLEDEGGVPPAPAPDDDVYFSGEEYYRQSDRRPGGGGEERHAVRRAAAASESNTHRLGRMQSADPGSADIADAGSSMRESLLGGSSEGDVDSVRAYRHRPRLPADVAEADGDAESCEAQEDVILRASSSRNGEEGDGEEDEDEDAGGASRSRSWSRSQGQGQGQAKSSSKSPLEDWNAAAAATDFAGLSRGSSTTAELVNGMDERGSSAQQTAMHGGGGGGFGGFGGFSFPSPSSHDALSRMDSGRSMWSVGDGTPDRERAMDDMEELGRSPSGGSVSRTMSGGGGGGGMGRPDDTLASWKRKSGGSSPAVSPGELTPLEAAHEDDKGSFSGEDAAALEAAVRGFDDEVQAAAAGESGSGSGSGGGGGQGLGLGLGLGLGSGLGPGLGLGLHKEEEEDDGLLLEEGSSNPSARDLLLEDEPPLVPPMELQAADVLIPVGDDDVVVGGRGGGTEQNHVQKKQGGGIVGHGSGSGAVAASGSAGVVGVAAGAGAGGAGVGGLPQQEGEQQQHHHHHQEALGSLEEERTEVAEDDEFEVINLKVIHRKNRCATTPTAPTPVARARVLALAQSITRQCLEALQFMHSLGLIHCDLKPENILVKSYSKCEVKVIDLGSSCFQTDHLCSYVQSRSYRAPEVILGLPYGQQIDIWSLGCILAELCSGQVLFQNDSLATLLARVVGILGPFDPQLLARGRETTKFFTKSRVLYQRNAETDQLEYLIPKKTSLKHRLPMGDAGFVEFVQYLLQVDPDKRPSASDALRHPWLSYPYDAFTT
eukprot:jgi/Mesen1/5589/ME000281S04648